MSNQPPDGTQVDALRLARLPRDALLPARLRPGGRPTRLGRGRRVDRRLPAALLRRASAPADDRRVLLLVVAMAALGVCGLAAEQRRQRVRHLRRGLLRHTSRRSSARSLVIAALVVVVGIIVLISPVPLPWRLFAHAPAFVFTIVIGAANVFDAERERARAPAAARGRGDRASRHARRAGAHRPRPARPAGAYAVGDRGEVRAGGAPCRARAGTRARSGDARAWSASAAKRSREVRAAVAGYRARGLRGELEGARQRARRGRRRDDLRDRACRPCRLPIESALAFALRESVTNVVRHAGARHTSDSHPHRKDRDVVLEVTDDGRGGSRAGGVRPDRHARTDHGPRRIA